MAPSNYLVGNIIQPIEGEEIPVAIIIENPVVIVNSDLDSGLDSNQSPTPDNRRTAYKYDRCIDKFCIFSIVSCFFIGIILLAGYVFSIFMVSVFNVDWNIFKSDIPSQLGVYFGIGFVIVILTCICVNYEKVKKSLAAND